MITFISEQIYLQVRLTWNQIGFIRPLYQALCIYLTIYTGFSRISDYKHHWSDVLIGLLQGTLVAILVTRFVSDLFVKNNNRYHPDSNGCSDSGPSGNAINLQQTPNYNSFRIDVEQNANKRTK